MFFCFLFFFNDTATTEIYTLSLHDALPIYGLIADLEVSADAGVPLGMEPARGEQRTEVPDAQVHARIARHDDASRDSDATTRSEEHTSELQSPDHLVCRLLLEKKKNNHRAI